MSKIVPIFIFFLCQSRSLYGQNFFSSAAIGHLNVGANDAVNGNFFPKGPIGSGFGQQPAPILGPDGIQAGQSSFDSPMMPNVVAPGFQSQQLQQQPQLSSWPKGADNMIPGVDTNMISSASAYGGPGGTYGGGQDSGYGSGAPNAGYGGGGPNAGYGGYPGRGGFSGYWEPGVKPVPLAQQGWGLFIPRPPVEITTPTTTVPPATTKPPTTTAHPGTAAPIKMAAESSMVSQMEPETFMVNGNRVVVMDVDTTNNNNDSTLVQTNPVAVASAAQPSKPEVNQIPSKTCIPKSDSKATGICVEESVLVVGCANMIVSLSDSCQDTQWCCYMDQAEEVPKPSLETTPDPAVPKPKFLWL